MAKSSRGGLRGRKIRGSAHQEVVNATAQAVETERLQRRRIRRSWLAGPAATWRRFRRLQSVRARFLLHGVEVEDGEGDRHHGAASCRRWLHGFGGVLHGGPRRRRN